MNEDSYVFHLRYLNPHVEDGLDQPRSLGFVEILTSEVFDEEDKVDFAAWHGFLVMLGNKAGNPCVGFRYVLKTGECRNCVSEKAFDTCLADMEDELVVTSEVRIGAVDIDVLPRYEFSVFLPDCNECSKIITTDAATASWEEFKEELRTLGGKDHAAFHYSRPRRNLLVDGRSTTPTDRTPTSCIGNSDAELGVQIVRVDCAAAFRRCLAHLYTLADDRHHSLRIELGYAPLIPTAPRSVASLVDLQRGEERSAARMELDVAVGDGGGAGGAGELRGVVAFTAADSWETVRHRLAALGPGAGAAGAGAGAVEVAFTFREPAAATEDGPAVVTVADEASWRECCRS